MYSLPASRVTLTGVGDELRRDAVDDLRCYRPSARVDPSPTEFLTRARERLDRGQHVYTLTADGILVHYSWLEHGALRCGSDFGHEFRFEAPAAVLWDDYTWPAARGRGLQTRAILRRLRDAAAGGAGTMIIGAVADNLVSRHNIEKLGFTYWASGWVRCRFGRVQRWITD